MASNRVRRVQKELVDMQNDKQAQVQAQLAGVRDDLMHIKGSFKGPDGTPYEGGEYIIDIKIPSDYPFKPPKMKFDTKIWHPNVSSQTGAICLDTLDTAWSPVLTIRSALISLQSLLSTPEPKDPQDAEVARMLMQRPKEFQRVAAEWAVKYAGATPRAKAGPSDEGNLTSSSNEKHSQQQGAGVNTAAYHGYNAQMVDGFVEMGFDRDRVVAAFEYVGLDSNGGRWYPMEEEYMGDVTARLLGEP